MMRTNRANALLVGAFLLTGTVASAIAQTTTEGHEGHHPAEAVPGTTAPQPGEAQGMDAMSMMGTETPGMQGMMQRMRSGEADQAGGMMCPMMQMQARNAEMQAMGGPGHLLGMPHGAPEEMTPERVRTLLGQWLTQLGNPRLEIGEIAAAPDGITAEIVTVDGSLVQKLAFNRYPGLVRQIP